MPQDGQSSLYPPDQIAFFHVPDKQRSPGGAISKVDNPTLLSKYNTPNHGTAIMYLFVSDLAEYMKVRRDWSSRSLRTLLRFSADNRRHVANPN
jgi:hypothetical protein